MHEILIYFMTLKLGVGYLQGGMEVLLEDLGTFSWDSVGRGG